MNDSSLHSSLLIRVQNQDAVSWQQFVHLYGAIILRWAQRLGLQDEDAADVSQEVLRAVMRGIGEFRRERSGDSFRGWLWTITRNKTLDLRRRQEREAIAAGGTAALQQLHEFPDALDESEERNESLGVVRRALALLQTDFHPQTWQAFWRIAVENASADQVAEELNMTKGAVYVAKSRCLARLREELAGLIDLDSLFTGGNA